MQAAPNLTDYTNDGANSLPDSFAAFFYSISLLVVNKEDWSDRGTSVYKYNNMYAEAVCCIKSYREFLIFSSQISIFITLSIRKRTQNVWLSQFLKLFISLCAYHLDKQYSGSMVPECRSGVGLLSNEHGIVFVLRQGYAPLVQATDPVIKYIMITCSEQSSEPGPNNNNNNEALLRYFLGPGDKEWR